MDRCIIRYGGSVSSGPAAYCAKGCAGMKGGKITDKDRYCRIAVENRLSQCNAGCSGASGSQDNRDICRFGCMFWNQSTGKLIFIFKSYCNKMFSESVEILQFLYFVAFIESVCPNGFPYFEKHSEFNHGDVCRDSKYHWACPVGCFNVGSIEPYCSTSSSDNSPCRVNAGNLFF